MAASFCYGSENTAVQPSACPPDPVQCPITDPYEGFNRAMFNFNDTLDVYILKPIATLYNKIIPIPLNKGIHNFFNNLNTIPTIANDILQLHFYQMANDMWRLGINTTLGIGGLFDIAACMGLAPYTNDFGLTLAWWGWKDSTYIVLPFFGPNTFRDVVEMPVDYYAFSVYPYISMRERYILYATSIIDKRAALLKFQDVMEVAALDKYIFVREAYLQRRVYQIEDSCHRSAAEQIAAKNTLPVAIPEEKVIEDTAVGVEVDSKSVMKMTTEKKIKIRSKLALQTAHKHVP